MINAGSLTNPEHYIGRFAPSPTGPLHFGSLLTATASYLDARANGGKWLLRMEDLDRPRIEPGAADKILATLETLGFEWDGEIIYQSQRDHVYEQYLDRLDKLGLLYPCSCSRKEIQSLAHAGLDGPVYPGTCRNGFSANRKARAWRVRVDNSIIEFQDQIQGPIKHHLTRDIGDFVLKRADGLFAYQLAVIVDDAEQGITHIVRGADLLSSTTRQIYLQQQLGLSTPRYAHIPLITTSDGAKLSKQNKAPPVSRANLRASLLSTIKMLGMIPPAHLFDESFPTIWNWAIDHWKINKLPSKEAIAIDIGSNH